MVFKDLIAKLNQISNEGISVPIDVDEKGYLDRQCPSEDCEFFFKVNEEDWLNIVSDDAVWCPFCRHEAPEVKATLRCPVVDGRPCPTC